jgi:cytochrome P450
MHDGATIDLDAHDAHLADSAFWAATPTFRHEVFAELRRSSPVRWYEPRTSAFSRPCTGFWALTRYDDVWHASRNPTVYCSGITIDIEEMPAELGEFYPSMINLDDPQHARLRRLVSSGFTPREVAKLDAALRSAAARIVDDLIDRFGGGEEFDLVAEVSSRLPLHAIAELVGVPPVDQAAIYEWTNAIVSPDDPSVGIDGAARAMRALADYALAMGADRRSSPRNDLASTLMAAEADGERLTPTEFANFMILLLSAGNETTRNAISHGIHLLTTHPEQRRILWDGFESYSWNAAEEIVRFETPISNMCRVLTEDVVIRGVPIAAGEKVALWYPSANRDAEVFPDADRFDVTRPTTPQQVGYGGGGPHFCLGANLARREIVVMLDEIRCRVPGLEVTGEPDRVVSMALNAIRSIPARIAAWP